MRALNVTDLVVLGLPALTHALPDEDFDRLFTKDRRVMIGCCGYGRDVVGLAFGGKDADRMYVEGYRGEGRTGYCVLMEGVRVELTGETQSIIHVDFRDIHRRKVRRDQIPLTEHTWGIGQRIQWSL